MPYHTPVDLQAHHVIKITTQHMIEPFKIYQCDKFLGRSFKWIPSFALKINSVSFCGASLTVGANSNLHGQE